MFDQIIYTANGNEYIINGDAPDLSNEFVHEVLFSIENKTKNSSFSYHIEIDPMLWKMYWKVDPQNEEHIDKICNLLLEKAKAFINKGHEEYLEVTLTALNTSKNLDEALTTIN